MNRRDRPDGLAAMIFALVDGLVLLEVAAGREHADAAIAALEALAGRG